jgi:hypothetical protein
VIDGIVALAHLIEGHDGAALARRVARDANHGLVHALARRLGLVDRRGRTHPAFLLLVGGAKTVLEVEARRVVLVVPYVVTVSNGTERELEWKQIEDGTVTCKVIDKGVKKEQAIKALLSDDRTTTLGKMSPKYVQECRAFNRAANDLGLGVGLAATALGAAIGVRRRRQG